MTTSQERRALPRHRGRRAFLLTAAAMAGAGCTRGRAERTLLNVSFDPTRELYRELNPLFAEDWFRRTGETVRIYMSHGGSGKQARAVADGLPADVVTLATPGDIDMIARRTGLVEAEWRQALPHGASPFNSTIVLLVRAGNPLAIRDWGDLGRAGVKVVCANPKTSGGARWNYLAAWAWADRAFAGEESAVRDFVGRMYRNAPVLDSGARASMATFAQRKIGDVLVTWENEALLAEKEFGTDKVQTVYPSLSIRAALPVAEVAGNAVRHGNLDLARAYLASLFEEAAQMTAVRHHFRPAVDEFAAAAGVQFRPMQQVTIEQAFGSWGEAQERHFASNGVFDQITRPAG